MPPAHTWAFPKSVWPVICKRYDLMAACHFFRNLFLSDQNRNEFFRKKADQKLFWRFIRADFLPSDKFCSKLRFRQFRKEVYEKFSAFFLHAGAHSEPGNLEYRDAGDTVVGKLQLSVPSEPRFQPEA